jgi:hypothetical protein
MAAVSAIGFVVIAAILCYGITAHLARREAIVTEKYGTFIKSNVLNGHILLITIYQKDWTQVQKL